MKEQILKLNANFEIIEWVIKSSGWEIDEILEKLEISKNTYEKWIKGLDKPTIKQLELIAWKTKRPLAIFFLDKVPQEKPTPNDFRLNPKQEGKFDKKTIFAIRKARKLQSILKDFGENTLGETIKELKIGTDNSPQETALNLREKFGITEELQRKTKDSWKFFRFLREKLGEEKVFNFQLSMPLEDARGFALSDELPRVVVVNSKDIIEARIFTLIHELGHVLLKDTEISIPSFIDTNKHEKWCNEFASSFLLPLEMAKRIFEENDKNLTEYDTLKYLSKKYKLSKSMLLYNMVKLKFIAPSDYEEILNKYTKNDYSKTKSGGLGVSAEKKCISELGASFISLVADNIDKKIITYSDALDYLSIKSRNFEKLMNKI
jgi:Zn-dependent peptidase ImmA (M78 family)